MVKSPIPLGVRAASTGVEIGVLEELRRASAGDTTKKAEHAAERKRVLSRIREREIALDPARKQERRQGFTANKRASRKRQHGTKEHDDRKDYDRTRKYAKAHGITPMTQEEVQQFQEEIAEAMSNDEEPNFQPNDCVMIIDGTHRGHLAVCKWFFGEERYEVMLRSRQTATLRRDQMQLCAFGDDTVLQDIIELQKFERRPPVRD